MHFILWCLVGANHQSHKIHIERLTSLLWYQTVKSKQGVILNTPPWSIPQNIKRWYGTFNLSVQKRLCVQFQISCHRDNHVKDKVKTQMYIIAQSITDVHHHEYLYSFTLNNSILMQYNTPQTHLKILKWNYCNDFINDRNLQKWTCYWCGSTHCLWSLQTGWEKQEWKRLQPRPFSKDWSDTLLTALQLHTYWWPNWTDKRKQVSGFVLFFLIWDLLWLAVAAVSHRWYIFKIVTGCVI